MKPLQLAFHPKKALELVQYHNPQEWAVDIYRPLVAILAMERQKQMGLSKALDNVISLNNSLADNIYTLAAYQRIMEIKVDQYKKIVEQINQINTQLLHLDSNKVMTPSDKSTLREFYQGRTKELEAKRYSLLSEPAVCRELNVIYEEVIPTAAI